MVLDGAGNRRGEITTGDTGDPGPHDVHVTDPQVVAVPMLVDDRGDDLPTVPLMISENRRFLHQINPGDHPNAVDDHTLPGVGFDRGDLTFPLMVEVVTRVLTPQRD